MARALGRREIVDHLLDRTRAVHVERDVDEVGCDGVNKGLALVLVAVLHQALAQVVAKRIDHELDKVGEDFLEDDVEIKFILLFELLLQVAAAVLVLAEQVQLADEVLERCSVETQDVVGVVVATLRKRGGRQRIWFEIRIKRRRAQIVAHVGIRTLVTARAEPLQEEPARLQLARQRVRVLAGGIKRQKGRHSVVFWGQRGQIEGSRPE